MKERGLQRGTHFKSLTLSSLPICFWINSCVCYGNMQRILKRREAIYSFWQYLNVLNRFPDPGSGNGPKVCHCPSGMLAEETVCGRVWSICSKMNLKHSLSQFFSWRNKASCQHARNCNCICLQAFSFVCLFKGKGTQRKPELIPLLPTCMALYILLTLSRVLLSTISA